MGISKKKKKIGNNLPTETLHVVGGHNEDMRVVIVEIRNTAMTRYYLLLERDRGRRGGLGVENPPHWHFQ